MKHIFIPALVLVAINPAFTGVSIAQETNLPASHAPEPSHDPSWHPTSEHYSRSGHEYLLAAVRDEVEARQFDDPSVQQRYNEVIDRFVRDGSNYGVSYVDHRQTLFDLYQELLTIDNPPPLYIQYRYHSSQVDLDGSPDRVMAKHADALLEVAYQMDQVGYPPYIAASTWLKAAEFMTSMNARQDGTIIAHIREHGIDLLVKAASLEGVEPRYQEFVSERIANFGFQYITLPLEDQKVLCQALLDNKDAEPWIGLYSSGGLRVKLAWNNRGGGYAYEITDEGWQEFERHLVRAHRHLTKAWERKPHWPQPATKLITATMGHQMRTDRPTAFWFQQAIEARTDHYKAYTAFTTDLLPKWHGSIEHLDGLARFIIDRSDEHGNMGRALIYVISSISNQLEDPYAALESDRYLPHMTRLMLDEVEVGLEYQNNPWRSRSLRAVALGNYRIGNYQSAAQLLRAGGAKTNLGWYAWDENLRFRNFSILLGSPCAQEVIEGLEHLDAGNRDAAHDAFKRAKKALNSRRSEIDPAHFGEPLETIDWAIKITKD